MPIPIKPDEELPARTPPIIEIGPAFLGRGNLPDGIELPTGAVWTPAFWVFGDYRTSINYVEPGEGDNDTVFEWANRLDLFGNLYLSGTERILVGITPLHDNGDFSGYTFEPESEFVNALQLDVTTFFFEGEIGEIFPDVDPEDAGFLDLGFAVGRQPIFFQEGLMINDTIDSVSLTRDTLIFPGITDIRVSGLFGWNEIHRETNAEDDDAYLVGLFTETDVPWSTLTADAIYVFSEDDDNDGNDGGDGFFFGLGGVQRIGIFNTAIRGNMSIATEEESAAVDTGGLLFAEISTTIVGSDNVAYGNFFWGIEDYTSAARGDLAGGPLGRVGLLFAAVGLGNYPAALSNRAQNVAGGSLGYQMFFNNYRTQLVVEVGGRAGTDDDVNNAAAIGARFQQALGRRYVVQVDGFARWEEDLEEGFGIRAEFLTRF